jgi:predicted DNA-binding transcriptional regulator AlpA
VETEIVQENLLSTKEAALYLGVSEAFLERDRWAGARVQYIKIGSRAVRYRLQDLENYIQSCIRKPTSYTDRK